jgi:CRP-like cAMP-binding protein
LFVSCRCRSGGHLGCHHLQKSTSLLPVIGKLAPDREATSLRDALARTVQRRRSELTAANRKEFQMDFERLEGQGVFQFLRPEQMRAISDVAEVVSFSAGDTVYEMGNPADHFYVVLDGQVSLRLPGRSGMSIQIDELTKGAMFGSCICFQLINYSLNAQCTSDSKLLRIESATLKELMDGDLLMGYTIQTQISRIYFNRYIDTMKKLQSIILNLPLETAQPQPTKMPVSA